MQQDFFDKVLRKVEIDESLLKPSKGMDEKLTADFTSSVSVLSISVQQEMKM